MGFLLLMGGWDGGATMYIRLPPRVPAYFCLYFFCTYVYVDDMGAGGIFLVWVNG